MTNRERIDYVWRNVLGYKIDWTPVSMLTLPVELEKLLNEAEERGRNSGLEEAARICEGCLESETPDYNPYYWNQAVERCILNIQGCL